jgi:pyruvate kinase
VRIERFATGRAALVEGDPFTLDTAHDPVGGTDRIVGVAYESLPRDVRAGDTLLLNDGLIALEVTAVAGTQVHTRVLTGGELSDMKGLNKQGGGLSAGALTAKDRDDIRMAAKLGVDYLAVSFVRDRNDIAEAWDLLRAAGGEGRIVAKIERREAIDNLESIVDETAAVMVARGDLGVEVGYAELTGLQKRIIALARARSRLVITATQMMESMIHAPVPTRAEVSDVANAVMDDTDAVMLSAETAVGAYPIEAVEAMSRIARAIESSSSYHDLPRVRFRQAEPTFSNATAMAAAQAAEALGIRKIICFTESGNTVRLLSRYRAEAEIIALTPSERTLNGMTVLSHVTPLMFRRELSLEDMLHEAQVLLLERGMVLQGEEVIFVAGVPPGVSRSTNVMKLHRIGEMTRMH